MNALLVKLHEMRAQGGKIRTHGLADPVLESKIGRAHV